MKKKITSLLLGLTLCLSLLPAAALADDAPLYEWKSQVPEDPDAIPYDIEVADFGTTPVTRPYGISTISFPKAATALTSLCPGRAGTVSANIW